MKESFNSRISVDTAQAVLTDNHDLLSRVCYPLFKNTPLKYFDYLKCYDDGTTTTLSICPDFVAKILTNSLLPTLEEFQLFSLYRQKATYLSTLTSLPPGASDLHPEKYEENIAHATDQGIYHRLYVVERREDYYVTYGFGVKNDDKTIINFYLNAMDYLEKFIRYFDFHCEYIIDLQLKKHQIILPTYQDKFIQEKMNITIAPLSIIDLHCNPRLKNSSLEFKSNLTAREKACLELVARGYTMKNVAIKLDISHRTVEQHLRNIKDKFGLSTKNQLVELWYEWE